MKQKSITERCQEFPSCISWTCLGTLLLQWELSSGKLAARRVHIWPQRKKIASEAGWHHTQARGPVKVCEPGFGGNNDSVPLNGYWFPLRLLWLLCTWAAFRHVPWLRCFARVLSSGGPQFKYGQDWEQTKWMAGMLVWKPDRQSILSSWKSIRIIRCWPMSLKSVLNRERGRGLARVYKQMATLLGNIK